MGMLPELILNKDEKKKMFRKQLAKKKQQAEKNIDEIKADVSAVTMKEEPITYCVAEQTPSY